MGPLLSWDERPIGCGGINVRKVSPQEEEVTQEERMKVEGAKQKAKDGGI